MQRPLWSSRRLISLAMVFSFVNTDYSVKMSYHITLLTNSLREGSLNTQSSSLISSIWWIGSSSSQHPWMSKRHFHLAALAAAVH